MSDSLKQAVEGLEAAWRRLREILDGPDVAAALVERYSPPVDHWRTHLNALRREFPDIAKQLEVDFSVGSRSLNDLGYAAKRLLDGARNQVQPISTAPRDGTVLIHVKNGEAVRCYWSQPRCSWITLGTGLMLEHWHIVGWSPVK